MTANACIYHVSLYTFIKRIAARRPGRSHPFEKNSWPSSLAITPQKGILRGDGGD